MTADEIAQAAADGPLTPARMAKVRRLCSRYRVKLADVVALIAQKLGEQADAWRKLS